MIYVAIDDDRDYLNGVKEHGEIADTKVDTSTIKLNNIYVQSIMMSSQYTRSTTDITMLITLPSTTVTATASSGRFIMIQLGDFSSSLFFRSSITCTLMNTLDTVNQFASNGNCQVFPGNNLKLVFGSTDALAASNA